MQLIPASHTNGLATFDPGSVCNLACVTCGPSASTRWQHELGIPVVSGNPKIIENHLINKVKSMTTVAIGGGEPLLNLSTETLLQHLSAEQYVRVHMNGTVLPKQTFLEISKKFHHITYCLSLDGTNQRFEYLRWPGKWARVVENINQLKDLAPDNVQFAVNITVSQLNKNYCHEVVEWVAHNLPQNRKGKTTVVEHSPAWGKLTKSYLDDLDKKRNLDWKQLFPLAVLDIN